MIAAFATFDNYQTDIGLDTPNSFIYFGTTITVANVEHITVKDPNGTPVFTWP